MSEPIIDLKDVLDRVQDDKELLVELFEIYADDFVVKRKDLGEAIAAKNLPRVKEVAHSMKGASGNISAKPLYALCLKLEHMAHDGTTDGMQDLLPAIDSQFEQIKAFAADFKKEQGG